MSTTEGSQASEPKRRRLDELFADEPHLSPTMKARRLHEKLLELRHDGEAAQGLPTEAYVSSAIDRRSAGRTPDEDRADSPAPVVPDRGTEPAVTLLQATAFLRGAANGEPGTHLPPAAEARLLAFRDRTLRPWLEGMRRG